MEGLFGALPGGPHPARPFAMATA
eukprot:ctg_4920.g530